MNWCRRPKPMQHFSGGGEGEGGEGGGGGGEYRDKMAVSKIHTKPRCIDVNGMACIETQLQMREACADHVHALVSSISPMSKGGYYPCKIVY